MKNKLTRENKRQAKPGSIILSTDNEVYIVTSFIDNCSDDKYGLVNLRTGEMGLSTFYTLEDLNEQLITHDDIIYDSDEVAIINI